jgi:RNA polymerase sigma-70 factor, ECF subfamily
MKGEGSDAWNIPHSSGAWKRENLLDGNRADYDSLIRPIEDRMIRSVWRIVRDPDDADDAFQEALATIWKRLGRIRRHANPHALILRICVNSAYDVRRRKSRRRRHEELKAITDIAADPAPSPAEQAVGRENREEIFEAIGRLPRNQAQAVLMRFVQELPYADIAQALDCKEATARKHIARARIRLRKALAHLAPRPTKEVLR